MWSERRIFAYFFWFCLPAVLAIACFMCDPFARAVFTEEIAIDQLTAGQRANLAVAARAIDGLILRPNETFSFNRSVGPRTYRRGYASSPSYVDSESPNTFGGGICVLSSLLYQVALKTGLTVMERHAHTRPMKTVAPGLDATVWYGGPDLKFKNTYSFPLQMRASVENADLKIILLAGRFQSILPTSQLTAISKRQNATDSCVSVYASRDKETRLVSQDVIHATRRTQ